MSRKPPKLVPIPGKVSNASPAERKSVDCMPPLQQGGNMNASANNNSGAPSLRRSGLTRHFLNCNGSSATKGRFSAKLSSSSSSPTTSQSSLNSNTPSNVDGTGKGSTSNGCRREDTCDTPPPPINKVNGTISNGVMPKSSESLKQLKRTKSYSDDNDEESSTSDSQQQQKSSVITFTNGRKIENSNSCTPGSVSTNNSQKLNVANATTSKRTSRFSQNNKLVSNNVHISTASSCESSPSSSPSMAEDSMPALVAYDKVSTLNKDSLAPDSLDSILDNQSVGSISEEPKIIRKGDTVIKSYVDEKTGKITVFEKEMKLEVCDFGSGKWYPAKVKNIDWTEQNILVHYSNWSSRYDEWISMKSNRVRPSKETNVVSLQFTVGEKVEAIWPTDSKKYLATVTQMLTQDMYEVIFDDGIKMKRSANQLGKVTSETLKSAEIKPSEEVDEVMEKETITEPEEKEITPMRTRKRGSIRNFKPQPVKKPVPEPEPIPTVPDLGADVPPGSRPAHFSMFDLPKGELGKRKRTVHDYSVLVKGRTPVPKGIRRPKSEGSSDLTAINNLMSSETSSVADDDETRSVEDTASPTKYEEPVNEKEAVIEPVATPPPTHSRRRKSAATTHVPTVKPSIDSPKELPVTDETALKSDSSADPPVDIPLKKRKHAVPHTTASVSSSTLAGGDNNTLSKSDSAQITPDLASAVSSNVSAPSSRRAKSLGTLQLSSVSPLIKTDVPNNTRVDSGFADESGNPIIIEVNANDGFWKCPVGTCAKNFRKEPLLQMHLKHYHPELTVTRGIANVVQMAQARTAFENEHPSDHHVWQKLPSSELTEGSKTDTTNETVAPSDTVASPHKRVSKTSGLSKESQEKVSPIVGQKSESAITNVTADAGATTSPQECTQTPNQFPRLRINRKRKFVIATLGRIRTNKKSLLNKVTPDTVPDLSKEKSAKVGIVTESSPNKKTRLSDAHDVTDKGEENTDPTCVISYSKSSSRTSSPSKSDKKSDQFGGKNFSVSAGSEPYLVPPFYELEALPPGSCRPSRDQWSRSRSLINSSRRRVGQSKLPNASSFLLKKRMQMRKFIGKRSRQKRTSILNRITSGRMRVISKSLNQRSLKRKRLRVTRRLRDVKVDVINCICNNKTEFGLMIQCEFCFCWQHGSCFNVQSNSQLPEYYACQSCSEPDEPRRSKPYEWAESEFFRLGKLPSFSFAPTFPKEDAWTMKRCNKLMAKLVETYSMIQDLQLNERICFGYPELPQLYQWNIERPPPQSLIQKDRFRKYFKPVLRRLLVENKTDSAYCQKLKKLAEARLKLKKYYDAVESAKLTMKKKLGWRNAAFLNYICDDVFNDMIKVARVDITEDSSKKGTVGKTSTVELAFQRLSAFRDEVSKTQSKEANVLGTGDAITARNSAFNSGASSSLFISGMQSTSGSTISNGLRKGVGTSVRDAALLTTYLKESRSLEENITSTILRLAKLFPEEWKNLMKVAKEFIKGCEKESVHSEKLKWVSSVIQTFNTLRILLKQIYSESNSQKQRNIVTDFEKATMKLLDLFGIGLAEEKNPNSHKRKSKKIRSLETFDMIDVAATTSIFMKSKPKAKGEAEISRQKLLARLSTSDEPLSSKDIENVLRTAQDLKDEEMEVSDSSKSETEVNEVRPEDKTTPQSANSSDSVKVSPSSLPYFKSRRLDSQLVLDFSDKVQLLEASNVLSAHHLDEFAEENVDLKFPEEDISDTIPVSSGSGIIPVPATSRITPDVCRRHLVRDVMLQQQQIDSYLDKIEGQIIRLSSQSRKSSSVTSTSPNQMSSEREQMLQSLEMVSVLSKTLIGDNDIVERSHCEDDDVSEATMSDCSDLESSSDSDDGDNNSNFSGTDTETADEGDKSGDDLLDI